MHANSNKFLNVWRHATSSSKQTERGTIFLICYAQALNAAAIVCVVWVIAYARNHYKDLLPQQQQLESSIVAEQSPLEAPLVSIIVPCYNQAPTLRRTLDSITRQSFPHFEVFVVNDGSPDGASFEAIAKEYSKELPNGVRVILVEGEGNPPPRMSPPPKRTIYFMSKPNGGLASVRNYAIEFATGKWILPLDGDDLLAAEYFETITAELSRYELDLVRPGIFNVICVSLRDLKGNPLPFTPSDVSKIDLRNGNAFAYSSMFLRTLYSEQNIVFREQLAWGWEDYDYWLQIQDKVGLHAFHVDKPLLIYSSDGEGRDVKDNMASFCQHHMKQCNAVFQIMNSHLYDDSILRQLLGTLLSDNKDENFLVLVERTRSWAKIIELYGAENPDPSVVFMVALQKHVQGEHKEAVQLLEKVVDMGCRAKGFERMAQLALSSMGLAIADRPTLATGHVCSYITNSHVLRADPRFNVIAGTFTGR